MQVTEVTENMASATQMPCLQSPDSQQSPATAFTGTIIPTQVTFKYKLGLAVVAFGMLLLAAVYVGLIGLVCYGVYYHVQHNGYWLSGTRGSLVALAAYFTVIIGGVVLVFFMVKPFFAGRPPEPDRFTLTPESDPVLFAFIARICELVKAPLPTRVDVDCQVNASASFRRGLRSLRGNDVMLTIGLPLAAGLTMQEFAGVLAHEFGHFAQGAGMRLTYIVRATSAWFARVVYERDEWDMHLVRAAHGIDFRIGIFLHLIRLCVWLSRRVLWVLMHLGRIISGFMLRQMEFDADSYETKVGGSAAFAQCTAKIQALTAASHWAHGQMEESWRNKRLPENLPSFIHLSVNNLTPELKKKVDELAAKDKTGVFDTHPCDAARVRAALALNEPGVFHLTAPASQLFSGFAELSKAATRFHYESNFELRIADHNLVSHDAVARESRMLAESETGLRDFFFSLRLKNRPIAMPSEVPDVTTADLFQQVAQAREAMEKAKPEVTKALREYDEADAWYQRGLNALRADAQQATDKAGATMRELAITLGQFERHAQVRLIGGLRLMNRPEVADKTPEAELLQKEIDQLTRVFECLSRVYTPLQEVRRKAEALVAAVDAGSDKHRRELAEVRINELTAQLQQTLAEIKPSLEGVPYPFQHAREGITLAELARTDIPASQKLQALYNDCVCHVDRLLPLYYRVLGRLAFIALQSEKQIPAAA